MTKTTVPISTRCLANSNKTPHSPLVPCHESGTGLDMPVKTNTDQERRVVTPDQPQQTPEQPEREGTQSDPAREQEQRREGDEREAGDPSAS